jgi:hypothetical protein
LGHRHSAARRQIAVDSRIGEFTEFAIRLPRVRAANN